jgi:multidrug efflux pump subunit AcrA (membrane-fusion protein)
VLEGVVIGLAVPSLALGAAMSSSEYSAAKDNANAAYKQARAQCDSMSGNPKDVCIAEAKSNLKKAKADVEARYKNTDKARRDAKIDAAEADYDVAKTKCEAKTGNDKDVCIKEAKAVETKAKADAKANERRSPPSRKKCTRGQDGRGLQGRARECDAQSGPAKDACVSEAKPATRSKCPPVPARGQTETRAPSLSRVHLGQMPRHPPFFIRRPCDFTGMYGRSGRASRRRNAAARRGTTAVLRNAR